MYACPMPTQAAEPLLPPFQPQAPPVGIAGPSRHAPTVIPSAGTKRNRASTAKQMTRFDPNGATVKPKRRRVAGLSHQAVEENSASLKAELFTS